MRYSRTFIPTMKEIPAEAEIPSHQLMIRAGYVRKVASGTYTYLPLGLRSLRKIEAIVREEMDAAGALEISLPILQPMELWEKTGRKEDYGPTMCRFVDRHGRENVLAPTAEEAVTLLASREIKSYRQLPVNLYQIHTKFRDEFRPRFGVLRSREFLMKDAYSFHADAASLEAEYHRMYAAYCRIFRRCGLEFVAVDAESGEMGGAESRQFTVPCDNGEDVIVRTDDSSYAANLAKAAVDPPPPTPRGQDAMEEVHTPDARTIEEVCGLLGTRPAEMIKTLIFAATDQTVVALVRGDHEINDEKLARAAGVGRLELADPETIRNLTGADVGFAGPMGLAERAGRMIVDAWVAAMPAGVAGANRTDTHVRNVVPERDFPLGDPRANVRVADIRNAIPGDTFHGQALSFQRGIEVGQVFQLGAKYSVALDATFRDEDGAERPLLMGCYGIGINRVLAAAIEIGHDDRGCVLPPSIAPHQVEVIPVNNNSEPVVAAAERIYDELQAAGIDALLDDRDVRAGVKFMDADLIGIPVRIVVGERSLKEGDVEIKLRTDEKPTPVSVDNAAPEAERLLHKDPA